MASSSGCCENCPGLTSAGCRVKLQARKPLTWELSPTCGATGAAPIYRPPSLKWGASLSLIETNLRRFSLSLFFISSGDVNTMIDPPICGICDACFACFFMFFLLSNRNHNNIFFFFFLFKPHLPLTGGLLAWHVCVCSIVSSCLV